MNIILTGSNGFIASNFLKLYAASFSRCIVLIRNKTKELEKYSNVSQVIWNLTEEIKCNVPSETIFIHTAYDSSNLNNNLIGIKNITRFIEQQKIKKLVYLSSVSVYDPFFEGNLTEEVSYSSLNDPYSYIKIRIERYLEKQSQNTLKEVSLLALQPSIVYGLYGNWSLHAIKTTYADKIEIPQGICCPVFVYDIAKAIFLSCGTSIEAGFHKFLISSEESTTWKVFYEFHSKIIGQTKLPVIVQMKTPFKKFHDSSFKNTLYKLLFSKPGVMIVGYLMPFLRKLKPLNTSVPFTIKEIVRQGNLLKVFRPFGMNRIVHSSKFKVSISKSRKTLKFTPEFTFDNALEVLKKELRHEG